MCKPCIQMHFDSATCDFIAVFSWIQFAALCKLGEDSLNLTHLNLERVSGGLVHPRSNNFHPSRELFESLSLVPLARSVEAWKQIEK